MITERKKKQKTYVDVTVNINVDKINRVVICEMLCRLQLEKVSNIPEHVLHNELTKKLPYIFGIAYEECEEPAFAMFQTKAIARCNSNDKFDVDYGIKLAETRARAKVYRKAKKAWAIIAQYLQQESLKFTSLSNISDGIACNEEERVTNLLK